MYVCMCCILLNKVHTTRTTIHLCIYYNTTTMMIGCSQQYNVHIKPIMLYDDGLQQFSSSLLFFGFVWYQCFCCYFFFLLNVPYFFVVGLLFFFSFSLFYIFCVWINRKVTGFGFKLLLNLKNIRVRLMFFFVMFKIFSI